MAKEPGMYYFQHRRPDLGDHWHDGYISLQSLQQFVTKIEHRRLQGTNKKREYRIINWQGQVIKTWLAAEPVRPYKEEEKGVMGNFIVQFIRDNDHEWKDFLPGSSNDIKFETEHEAWAWARKRSRMGGHKTTIYRVLDTATGVQRGEPYINGITLGSQMEANRRQTTVHSSKNIKVYEMFWKSSSGSGWTPFNSADKNTHQGIEAAIKRVADTCFTGKHLIRVWEDGQIIYEGKAKTAELVAWLEAYASSSTTQGQEASPMDYEARKALSVPRTTLIEKLDENVAAAKAKHDEAAEKVLAEAAKSVEALQALATENPLTLVRIMESYIRSDFFRTNPDNGELYGKQTIDSYNKETTGEFVPDPQVTKLLSVLNAAIDETIEVTPSDDFYRYL